MKYGRLFALVVSILFFVGCGLGLPELYKPPTYMGTIAHASGQVLGHNYTNSMEGLQTSYDRGIKTMELDVHLNDGVLRFYHNLDDRKITLELGLTPVNINLLKDWLTTHPTVKITLDIKDDKTLPALKVLKKLDPLYSERYIPEVGYWGFSRVVDLGFDSVALSSPSVAELKKVQRSKVYAVFMNRESADNGLAIEASNLGMSAMMWTIDDPAWRKEYKIKGVGGVISNVLP